MRSISATTAAANKASLEPPRISSWRCSGWLRPRKRRWSGIDQICINQHEDEDKNSQVEVMSEIYPAAGSVVVYLGEPTLDVNLEPEMLSGILYSLSTIDGFGVVTAADFSKLGLPAAESPIWHFLAEVFASPWFTQLWTLQEVVLATEIHLLFGRHELDWELWWSLSHSLLKTQLHRFIAGRTVSRPAAGPAGFSTVVQVQLLRDSWARGSLPLAHILEAGTMKQCTLPVDRIYASRGMLSKRARALIKVDYSKPAHEVFAHIFKLVIQGGPSFWLLSSVGSRGTLEGLPSWCPDLNQPLLESPLSTVSLLVGYHAGFQLPPDAPDVFDFVTKRQSIENLVEIVPSSNRIRVSGMSVDVVETVCDAEWRWPQPYDPEIGRQTLEWEKACLSIAQKTLQNHAGVPEEHWRCLIANKTSSNQRCVADLSEDYRETIRYLNLVADSKIPSPDLSSDQTSRVLKFAVAVHDACKSRRYFSTRGGRLGLGPGACSVGDLVCVFHDAAVPYILRRIADSSSSSGAASDGAAEECYTFVGESYVHGLMYAEAFDLRDAGKVTEKKFTIE